MNLLEELATLYFRLNGYFTAPNFLLHQESGRTSLTDIDILAVRFPYQQEIPYQQQIAFDNDPKLVLSNSQLTDVVLVEVKRSRTEFNESWKRRENIEYVLRWVGFTSNKDEVELVARDLQRNKKTTSGNFHFRMMLLTGGSSAEDYIIPLDDVLSFIKERFNKYRLQKREHSPWRGTLADWLFRQGQDDFPKTIEDLEERFKITTVNPTSTTNLFTYGALMDPFKFYQRIRTNNKDVNIDRLHEVRICLANDYARGMNKVANEGVRLNLVYSKGKKVRGILYYDVTSKEIGRLKNYELGYNLKDINTNLGKAEVFLASEEKTTSKARMTEASRNYLNDVASVAKRWGEQFYQDFVSNLFDADGTALKDEQCH